MKNGKAGNQKEDLAIYILAGLVAAWAIVCITILLMRAK
jgi:hypothetical protein